MGVQERDALLPEKYLFPIGKEGWFPLNRNLCNINKKIWNSWYANDETKVGLKASESLPLYLFA